MPMAVRFCAMAGPQIGRGHLARVLSLAEAAWPAGTVLELEHAVGALSQAERARAEASGLRLVEPEVAAVDGTVVVLDGPDPNALAKRWNATRMVVFDDTERFQGEAAIVVQPSAPGWHGQARAGKILTGYGWAPIGIAWRVLIGTDTPAATRDRPHVLVCFGGSDPHAVTARLAPAIARHPAWNATIIIGHDYRGPRPAGVDLTPDPADLPTRVLDADIVVLGAGTMKFEAAALGRPALLVAAADDQLAVGPPFAATGAARWLGDGRTIDPDVVVAALREFIADGPAREAMSAAARRVVDGDGSDRLAAEILRLAG